MYVRFDVQYNFLGHFSQLFMWKGRIGELVRMYVIFAAMRL